jgi:hypothetical protein
MNVNQPQSFVTGRRRSRWPFSLLMADAGHAESPSAVSCEGRVLLVRVSREANSVQVQRHLSADTGIRGQRPYIGSDFGTCRAIRRERLPAARGQGVVEAGDRGIGGDRPWHGRPGPQQRDVGEAVTPKATAAATATARAPNRHRPRDGRDGTWPLDGSALNSGMRHVRFAGSQRASLPPPRTSIEPAPSQVATEGTA